MIPIFISNYCNRECDHCYTNPLKSNEKMSIEGAEDVSTWISNTYQEENVEALNVAFLGGEPTTNIERVFQIIDSLHNKLPLLSKTQVWGGKGRYFDIFTNGDLLNEETLRELKKRRVVVFLNPTYDTLDGIEKKIIKIKSICGGCSLAIALNDVNLLRLEDLTKLAIKYRCSIRTNRLYDGGIIPGYVEEYKRQMHGMFDLLLKDPIPMSPNWIMESTIPTYSGPKNPCLCGKYFLVIDVDGTIRSCNPDPDTKVGHIDTTSFRDIKFPQRWSAKNLPECQGCEYVVHCQGGCPYTRKLYCGDYNHKTPFCSAFKELFPKLYALRDKWLKYYA